MKGEKIPDYSDAGLDIYMNYIGTLWEYIYTLQVVSFLVFHAKMHPWNSTAIFGASVHTP